MTLQEALLVVAAGWVAGVVNTIAGAGSLLTFPALLAVGLPPLTANVTNSIGVVPGSVSGAWAMRRRLSGARTELIGLGACAALGALVGGGILLLLPSSAFDRVVPVLVGLAGLLVLCQPLVARRAQRAMVAPARPSRFTPAAVAGLGVYAGYFGAAIGVLLLGVLGLLTRDELSTVNAKKNVISAAANGTAGVLFAIVAPVHWVAALLLAAGSVTGGPVGAMLATRVPAGPLRLLIAGISIVVAVRLGVEAY